MINKTIAISKTDYKIKKKGWFELIKNGKCRTIFHMLQFLEFWFSFTSMQFLLVDKAEKNE